MNFHVDEKLFEIFPDLKVGVIVVEVENSIYGDDKLETIVDEIKKNFSYEKPQDHPYIRVWREAFSKVGISPSKFYSSIEALLRRALKGGPFPRINPLVDLYNALSLKYLVPIGGHALEPIDGNIYVTFASGEETFLPMNGTEIEKVDKNEVVYKDEKEVLTRRWVWRQCDKDKVTEKTRYVFLPIDLMEGVPLSTYEDIAMRIEEYFRENRNGSIILKDVVSKDRNSIVFDFPFLRKP